MSNNDSKYNTIFFGTDRFACIVLDELHKAGMTPRAIVTQPDKPQGRGNIITPPESKVWAQEHGVHVFQPEKLDNEFITSLDEYASELGIDAWDLFLTASYGKIIPQRILEIPTHGPLNVHPSLLPEFRGPSPIESAMLADQKETGVTIMLMDEKMDHGPILNQEIVTFDSWPKREVVEEKLAHVGGALLVETIPQRIEGTVEEQKQDHDAATFSTMISKKDAKISLKDDPYKNFLKIQAYSGWPRAYFFVKRKDKEIRVVVTETTFDNSELTILKVIPEGAKEVNYSDFMKNI